MRVGFNLQLLGLGFSVQDTVGFSDWCGMPCNTVIAALPL